MKIVLPFDTRANAPCIRAHATRGCPRVLPPPGPPVATNGRSARADEPSTGAATRRPRAHPLRLDVSQSPTRATFSARPAVRSAFRNADGRPYLRVSTLERRRSRGGCTEPTTSTRPRDAGPLSSASRHAASSWTNGEGGHPSGRRSAPAATTPIHRRTAPAPARPTGLVGSAAHEQAMNVFSVRGRQIARATRRTACTPAKGHHLSMWPHGASFRLGL